MPGPMQLHPYNPTRYTHRYTHIFSHTQNTVAKRRKSTTLWPAAVNTETVRNKSMRDGGEKSQEGLLWTHQKSKKKVPPLLLALAPPFCKYHSFLSFPFPSSPLTFSYFFSSLPLRSSHQPVIYWCMKRRRILYRLEMSAELRPLWKSECLCWRCIYLSQDHDFTSPHKTALGVSTASL